MFSVSKICTALIFLPLSVLGQEVCSQLQELLKSGQLEKSNALIVHENLKQIDCPLIVGEIFLRKGRFDKAEEYFLLALNTAEHGTEDEATGLNQLGLTYYYSGNSIEAVEYIERGLTLRKDIYKSENEKIAASYNDLGLVLSNSDQDKALEFYEKALEIYKSTYGENHEKVAQALINTGTLYSAIDFFGDAINNLNEALDIWQRKYPEGHPNTAFVYSVLGSTSLQMNNVDEASKYQQKALEIYKNTLGNKHPDVASTYNLLGNNLAQEGKFDEALEYYQKALIANAQSFSEMDLNANPDTGDYLNGLTMLTSLDSKAQALANKHFVKTLKFNDLKSALETYQTCDLLIDNIRRVTTSEAQKLVISAMSAKIYEQSLFVSMALADIAVKKEPFYQLAYYFAEKSKAAVLLDAISDASAKSYANIPSELLEQEAQFKSDIVYFEQQLSNADTENKQWLEDVLFKLKQSHQQFIKNIEKDYPQYFNLKYNVSIPSTQDLQRKMNPNAMLISYFIAEENQRVYIFQITADKFKVESHTIDDDFNRYIAGLRNSIFFQTRDSYVLTATELYKKLMPKNFPKNINQLILVPAGKLGIIPFEALLSKKVKSGVPMNEMPYLINSYAVSYQYSTALYFQSLIQPQHSSSKALLCAPVDFENLPDLPGTRMELNNLKNIFSKQQIESDILMEQHAAEEELKSQLKQHYKYVHLATHGVVDEVQPEKSRIFLNNKGSEDGNLFSSEIYNLKLEADLVTLSACETGLGKVSKGEGVIGLSRALVYAGARNLVVSLWQVADNSTSDLMTNFYGSIDKVEYSYALQSAKKTMAGSTDFAHPFYWAPFILIGK